MKESLEQILLLCFFKTTVGCSKVGYCQVTERLGSFDIMHMVLQMTDIREGKLVLARKLVSEDPFE